MPNIFSQAFTSFAMKFNPAWLHVSSYSDTPQAIPMNRNYRTYAKEGYKNSDSLYKCISYIIRNGSAIPPVLYANKSEVTKPDGKRIDTHPLLDKLNHPNNEQTGVQYREAVLGYKLLAGNSFQYAIRAGRNGPPDELWALRPDRMQLLVVPQKGVTGYKHEDMKEPIDPANVGHTKYWNPDDDNESGMGMSPVEAAALNVDMQIAGKKWNLGLLQNGARPPGIWKIPVLMGQNERQKLEDKLNEKFGGAKSAGKSPLFDGGLDWKGTGLAPAQMDYLDSLKYNGGSIANIYNMAPQLVGDTGASTYDNMKQAKVWSYTEAIFPELDDLYSLWQNWLVPMYPDLVRSGAYLYYDKESVEVIQELIQAQKDAKAQRANQLWLDGIAMQSEARALAGLPEMSGGRVFRIGNILVPADKVEEYALQSLTEPAAPPMPMPEPLDGPVQPQSENNLPDSGNNPPQNENKAVNLRTKTASHSVDDMRQSWYDEATDRLQRYFIDEREAVVNAINAAAMPQTAILRVEAVFKGREQLLVTFLAGLYQDVGEDIGGQVAAQLQQKSIKAISFGSDVISKLVQIATQKAQDIIATTLNKIKEVLTVGVQHGASTAELAQQVDDLYKEQFIPVRAEAIAGDEVAMASNIASVEAARASGSTTKTWHTMEDDRVRPAHRLADDQEVGIDEPFDVGGEDLQYPGDPAGSPGNILGCRCHLTFAGNGALSGDMGKGKSGRERREEYRKFMSEVLA